jgi:nicotinamidase-related amidase
MGPRVLINGIWYKLVKRVVDLASKVDAFLKHARKLHIPIIHAPSDCGRFYKDFPQLKTLHKVKYDENYWQQVVTDGYGVWSTDKAPWLYENGDPRSNNGTPIYEHWLDEDNMPPPPQGTAAGSYWASPNKPHLHQIETIQICPEDLMVIDNYICTEPGCPKVNKGNDGHFHLAQFLANKGIEWLLYVGVVTNYCVVFARPYSLWPMSTFIKKGDPPDGSHQIFKAPLVRDLTVTFMHPIDPDPNKDPNKQAEENFLKWLMSGGKNNFDPKLRRHDVHDLLGRLD